MISNPTETVITYGKALASAIRAFRVLETKANWFERMLIKLLRASYQKRLRVMVGTLPSEVAEEIIGVGGDVCND